MQPDRMPFSDPLIVDVVAVRKDGGLDMVISVSGPIDDSPATLQALEQKVRNYLLGATSEKFIAQYGCKPGCKVSIYLSCRHPISGHALMLIDKLRGVARDEGVDFFIERDMSNPH